MQLMDVFTEAFLVIVLPEKAMERRLEGKLEISACVPINCCSFGFSGLGVREQFSCAALMQRVSGACGEDAGYARSHLKTGRR